ncbi:hypothetical protein DPMN_128711 [Dreissena polymorpha]|uniref:Uncharacterized protein n=1 Tax=Dreissena polymorpha TaxID=45954 RepID=A0A9D4H4G5_DREPO|nr:hypothetical protein DPMN_128711 [Dreissena polymorpha]
MPEAYGIWKMKIVDVQINTFVVIFVWLPWFLLLGIVSSAGTDPPCEDFDTSGCLSNPGLCSIPDLSISTCPKSCNKCPFYCYHCDHPVSAVSRCTNVTACQGDKQCLYMHVTSSIDGHEEFTLKCVEPTVCNTKRMLQTRNVQMHCCTGNYCNKMQTPTTRATSTTTTVLTTTTRTTSTTTTLLTTTAQDCNKDIIFIAEESQNIGNV